MSDLPLKEAFLEVIGLVTAKFLLPVVSFGRKNARRAARRQRRLLQWHGVKHIGNGRFLLPQGLASFVGLVLFVAIVLALGFAWFSIATPEPAP